MAWAAVAPIAIPETQLVATDRGQCALGVFGAATFWSPCFPLVQLWYLSDGSACFRAVYICPSMTAFHGIDTVRQILLALRLERAVTA